MGSCKSLSVSYPSLVRQSSSVGIIADLDSWLMFSWRTCPWWSVSPCLSVFLGHFVLALFLIASSHFVSFCTLSFQGVCWCSFPSCLSFLPASSSCLTVLRMHVSLASGYPADVSVIEGQREKEESSTPRKSTGWVPRTERSRVCVSECQRLTSKTPGGERGRPIAPQRKQGKKRERQEERERENVTGLPPCCLLCCTLFPLLWRIFIHPLSRTV